MGFGGRGFGRGNRGGHSGGRGFGRGGGHRGFDSGPPERVQEFGVFTHECENQLVVKSLIEEVPFFNAPIYLEDMTQVGKVDEIFGGIRDYSVSVTLLDTFKSSSFSLNQKLYIDPNKLLPLQRFLPKPPGTDSKPKGAGRGTPRGSRGGRGGGNFRGGGGGFRGRDSGGGGGGFRGRDSGGGGFRGRDSGGFRGRDSGGRGRGGNGRGFGGDRRGGFGGDRRGGFGNRGGDGGFNRNFNSH
ncbi:H/ACA ribonucleoprotein complex subunit 1-like protein [Dinothrombium tinctorium]|uniref:H/ACA ribonucleoprotein complex subunit n=1 Tax=Dinothrombium tinctorium TaxID=1965070 RepID=A0A3S3NW37_9ACAR|nr:H/ACA ribonucleoprotein complex subunit 1-like protein [Dinothrombium tinctorium]RWS03009.1 H/ACA ribonucleoprotein complex subunit 1-like protein [Dinothrombium tinctorium]RWS17227.1 H/ACA ribonucleoprotein complex subunit 1-like protein [Dinothrombium tinctorium]